MDNSYKLEKRAVIAAVSSTLSRRNEYDTGQVCRKVENAVNQWTASHNRKVIKLVHGLLALKHITVLLMCLSDAFQ